MKVQLANRTYRRLYAGCCQCAFAHITYDRHIRRIDCPDFILQPCYRAFKKKLFNDKIFKL